MTNNRKITIAELNNIANYPPVQNLIKILLKKGYFVNLIGVNVSEISEEIKNNSSFNAIETSLFQGNLSVWKHRINTLYIKHSARAALKTCMKTSDILWTTSMKTSSLIGKQSMKYKTVLQLMELAKDGYLFRQYFKFPIKKYAQSAWKTVVPEVNRAYIQKIWYELDRIPIVLPNKPFSIDYGEISPEISNAISIMEKEKKKIILYLGGMYADRDFESYAKAISKMDDYTLYIIGKVSSDEGKALLEKLIKKYNAVYLGGFNPPKHLAFVKYAHIGLLPYTPKKSPILSELNALYCAPNKIWEYAGFGVPMVGSDVLGLKLPFERWNIGRCCDLNNESSVIKSIEDVDRNHEEMSRNCYKFYDSVDLERIVSEILEDEN